jgi:signal transduction histidine kinase
MEKDFFQILEHEALTHLSVIKHELDDFNLEIHALKKHVLSELAFLKSDTIISKLDSMRFRVQVSQFELDLLQYKIRRQTVSGTPQDRYYFSTIRLSPLVIRCYSHASYYCNLNGIQIGPFVEQRTVLLQNNFLITVDPFMFQVAFQQLLDNAVRFCRKPANRDDPQIWIEIDFPNIPSGTCFHLAVCNKGPMIPPQHEELIFEKGFSFNYDNEPYSAGNGLGLFISRTILRNMQGDVFLAKSRRDCTAFVITIPTHDRRI